jgi:hypothetical protein
MQQAVVARFISRGLHDLQRHRKRFIPAVRIVLQQNTSFPLNNMVFHAAIPY